MKALQFIFLFFLGITVWQCEKDDPSELKEKILKITLKNTEVYQHDFIISGDEEGASIVMQAKHALRSEIIRYKSTNWSVVYVYQPKDNFTGIDSVEIETCTGGDGTAATPCNKEAVKLKFQIID